MTTRRGFFGVLADQSAVLDRMLADLNRQAYEWYRLYATPPPFCLVPPSAPGQDRPHVSAS